MGKRDIALFNDADCLYLDLSNLEAGSDKMDKLLSSEDQINNIFDEIRELLKSQYSHIVYELSSNPNKVFKISKDIDTWNIREKISNVNTTCFYEEGRIINYSNFLNEFLFGNQFEIKSSDFTDALNLLFLNYSLSYENVLDLNKSLEVSNDDFLYSIYRMLKDSSLINEVFNISFDDYEVSIQAKKGLINKLKDFKSLIIN
ncbi:hypothetical protein CL656_01305 [bacterium]|nr:hypothetical protein [bacterium]|tara:strand:- start:9382 stop:9987 length:606 start_codon:yes stop_codon:yes gene_type:complete